MSSGSAPAGGIYAEIVVDLGPLDTAIGSANAKLKTAGAQMAGDLSKVEAGVKRTTAAVSGLADATGKEAAAQANSTRVREQSVGMSARLEAQTRKALAAQADYERQMTAAGIANDNVAASYGRMGAVLSSALPHMERLSASAATLGIAGAAATGAVAVTALAVTIAKAGDEYVRYDNLLKAAGVSTAGVAGVTRDLAGIAVATRTPLDGIVQLYARLTRVSGDLGISQADVRRGTELLTKSIANSGLSSAEASAGVLQLSQALQSGVLQGDELRSLLETMPDVTRAVAREFGVTVGALKDLGAEGKLTSDRVFKAIIAAGPEIEASFAKTTPTIASATTAATEAFKHLGAEMDRIVGLSPAVAKVIDGVAALAERAAQKVGNPDFGFDGQIKAIEAQRALIARLEASSGGQSDLTLDAAREQLDRLEQSLLRTTLAAAPLLDGKIQDQVGQIAPPMRLVADETARLTAEAEAARNVVPGLEGALANLGGAASEAAAKIASVSAGIRALQTLNPNLSGALGYLDKVGAVQAVYQKTLGNIDSEFQKTGDNATKIRDTAAAMDEQQRALKALGEQRDKPLAAVVREGELSKMGDLDKSLAQIGDRFGDLRREREDLSRVLQGSAASPEDAAKIKRQFDAQIAQLDGAQKSLEAKARADEAAKAARSAGSGSETDGFDGAIQRAKDQTAELKIQAEAASKTSVEYYKLVESNRLWRAAQQAGRADEAGVAATIDATADALARQREATNRALEAQRQMQAGARALGDDFSRFFDDVLFGARGMADAFENASRSLASSGLRAILTGEGPHAEVAGEESGLGALFGLPARKQDTTEPETKPDERDQRHAGGEGGLRVHGRRQLPAGWRAAQRHHEGRDPGAPAHCALGARAEPVPAARRAASR